MTYEEIKNKLSICEKALTSIKTGGYKNLTEKDTQLKIQELRTLKEGLEKKLNEQDGVVQTDDEAKAEKLAKKGVNVKLQDKLTEQDKGVQFGQNETAAIAMEVGKATVKALLAVGEELASMRAINIRPNSFDIKAVFKGEKGEEVFNFYVEEDTLHLNDISFDKEIADVGVMPSGKPLVNVDVIANELQKHFRSLSEVSEGEGDDHHYIKVPRTQYKKAQSVIDDVLRNDVYGGHKHDIVDNDGRGNVIFYFMGPEEKAITYDAVVYLRNSDVDVVDSSVSDIDESPMTMAYTKIVKGKDKNEVKEAINLVHVYDKDGSIFGTGEIVKNLPNDKVKVRFDGNFMGTFRADRVKPVQEGEREVERYAEDYIEIARRYVSKFTNYETLLKRMSDNQLEKLGEKVIDKYYDGNIKNAYQDLVKEALGDDVPDSMKGSVSKLQKVHSMIVNKMKSFAKMYKEKGGDHIFKSYTGEENRVIDILKDLNDKKKKVEIELDKAVAGTGKGQELSELSVDKEDALDELRDILGRVQDLGQSAREIVRQEFPSYLSKGDAYGVFDMGSSTNRYDTTLESMIDGIEQYYDEEEDMDEAELNRSEKKKLKDMSKSLKKSSKGHAGQAKYIDKLVKEGRGDMDMITRIIDDRADESGFEPKEEAAEVIAAIADHYKLNLKMIQNYIDSDESVNPFSEEKKDIEKEKKDYDKEIEHDCANHVLHEKYGHGICLEGQHTLLEDGTVTHYDVFFKEGSKTVKNIPLNELKVITSSHHGHKRRKK